MTDHIVATAFNDLQTRAGIPPVDELLAKLSDMTRQWANHAALFDNFGLWESERKRRLALAALQVRAAKDALGAKYTQGIVEDEAHCWPAYVKFLNESVTGKAEWLVAKDEMDAIRQRINRGNVMVKFAANEPR
jgi:hypothetical protein